MRLTLLARISAIIMTSAFCGVASASTVSGIEIYGEIKHGDNYHFIEHFLDNFITSGEVVNSYGDFVVEHGLTIDPLPVHLKDGGRQNPISIRNFAVPNYYRDDPNVIQDYGHYYPFLTHWYNPYYENARVSRSTFSFNIGKYEFNSSAHASDYDDGVLNIVFAGIGSLTDGSDVHSVEFFMVTAFDNPWAPYKMIIRTPTPIPLPPSFALMLAPVMLLGGSRASSYLRRRSSGRA